MKLQQKQTEKQQIALELRKNALSGSQKGKKVKKKKKQGKSALLNKVFTSEGKQKAAELLEKIVTKEYNIKKLKKKIEEGNGTYSMVDVINYMVLCKKSTTILNTLINKYFPSKLDLMNNKTKMNFFLNPKVVINEIDKESVHSTSGENEVIDGERGEG